MKRSCLIGLLAICAAPAAAEKLNNDTVIALISAGLGDEAVIAKIKASEADFDLSTEQMIQLKNKGVSGPVIAAMLGAGAPKAPALSMDSPDPMIPHYAGFYVLSGSGEGAKMRRIDPTVTNQAKTGGLIGFALTGGIASMSIKATVPGARARISTTGTPNFYLFFDEASSGSNGQSVWNGGTMTTIQSPAELTLIQLDSKDGRREARVGSSNIGGTKVGVMDKDRVSFDYELVRPGVFKVKPGSTLRKGQYGFIYSLSGGGAGGALAARIFDFEVQ